VKNNQSSVCHTVTLNPVREELTKGFAQAILGLLSALSSLTVIEKTALHTVHLGRGPNHSLSHQVNFWECV
jgi:hypothetical protein